MRDADPARMIEAVKTNSNGLGGFRFFHDHDRRVLDICLDDPRCAKIILTRNPVDSYVSWKIAQATGQWKLTNVKRRKDSSIKFDGPEFETHVSQLQKFQVFLLNRLQITGQTAFMSITTIFSLSKSSTGWQSFLAAMNGWRRLTRR